MRLILPTLLCVFAAGEATAQQSLSESDIRSVGDRNRERMHPGQPLHVVGAEQEDNSFRERTPSLIRAEKVAVIVDPDENYRRRLAMYDSGQRFDSAPATQARVLARDPNQAVARHEVEKKKAPKAPVDDRGNKALFSGMGLIAGLVFLIRKLSS